MSFPQIGAGKKPKDISKDILKYWESEAIFSRIKEMRSEGEDYRFLEGPPTANGHPHVGHALTRTIKDTVLRYKTMRGYNVTRRDAGWDCHGLPVELEAEKKFGFKSKADIESYGVDKFNAYCRESIFRYVEEWLDVDRNLGFWIDHENAYVTMRNDYMESEWWALKTLFDRKVLYRDYRISPYCPRCGTTLSSHELSQGYKDTKDLSIYADFILEDGRIVVAWTTTPWTLPSNMFLAVNEDIEYADVVYNTKTYIVAKNLVAKIFVKDYEIKRTYLGKELIGLKYSRPIEFVKMPSNVLRVVHGDHVNLNEGTGIVHTAPAFGSEDFEIGKREGVEIVNPVNLQGKFQYEGLPWNGLSVKEADIEIVKYLKEKGLALKSEKYEHSYPFCYRCDTPLLYYPIEAWFLRVSAHRNELLKNNELVNWVPEHIKHGRFGNFIEEAKDWNLSRNRYWGTPLPVWTCSNGHMKAIGSRKELQEMGVKEVPEDLHRPFIDLVVFSCPECGETMKREPYVIDTWFDSGSATYAAIHYPFEGTEKPQIPVSFITEGIDQTRGWFYTLHVISTLIFDKNAYENVFCTEFILDSQGRKMSKSKGNGVLAKEMIDKFGPDASRLFFYTTAPWKPKPLVEKTVKETETKILGTLMNIYSFFASNANLDNFSYSGLKKSGNELDTWLVSRVNSTIKDVIVAYDSYDLSEAQSIISRLIDETSNFYLRLSRRRFWEQSDEKDVAYSTLYYALENICRMLAPIAPFTTEFLYRSLNEKAISVHAQDFPSSDKHLILEDLEISMERSREILELTRRARQDADIKGRQPVKEILLYGKNLEDKQISPVREEMNANKVRIINTSEIPSKQVVKVVLSQVAPILKGKLQSFVQFIDDLNTSGKQGSVSENEGISFEGFELPPGSVQILEEPLENFVKATEGDITIYLNKEIDHELELSGLSRELIRRIQVMRKEMDLDYDQKINVRISGSSELLEAAKFREQIIKEETLCTDLAIEDGRGKSSIIYSKKSDWDIDEKNVVIEITAA